MNLVGLSVTLLNLQEFASLSKELSQARELILEKDEEISELKQSRSEEMIDEASRKAELEEQKRRLREFGLSGLVERR